MAEGGSTMVQEEDEEEGDLVEREKDEKGSR